jgi:hypothetical protein
MKSQHLLFSVLFAAVILCTGLKTINKQTSSDNKIAAGDWGEWVNDDCFEGIDYRAKRGDFNSYANKWNWYVQFRNRYNQRLNFNYAIGEPGTRPDPDHRTYISSNGTSDSKIALLISSSSCRVRVGYVRFGYDDSGSYEKCDQ